MGLNRLTLALARARAAGKQVLDLTASNSTECGFTYDREGILGALTDPASLTYEPDACGLPAARKAVCEYYAGRGDSVSPESMVLTTSTSEAYSFVFRLLCDAGDEVLVPQPSYPLFDFLAELADVRLQRYPLIYDHGWQIDFHSLEEALTARTRALIVVHPNNPTGSFCKAQEITRLNDICAGRGTAIIADEVFLDYSLGDSAPQSFVTNAGALTFTLSGLSKICGLPQMKAAWVVASGPKEMQRESLRRLEVIADTYLSMNAPVQHALAAFLRQREPFHKQVMRRVRQNLAELDRQLSRESACGRMLVEGGWCAVLRVPATRSDEDLAFELVSTRGVLVHPGHFYDFSGSGTIVLSLIVPSEDFSRGLAEILAFAR